MTLEDVLRKNKRLKNLHAGKRCFIIGNGPSTNAQALTHLKDEVSIAVNAFFRHPKAKEIHPEYWVVADPSMWEKAEEYFLPVLRMAGEHAVSPRLFVPTDGFNYFSAVNLGPLIDLHFFKYDPSMTIDSEIDFSKGIVPYGQNILNIALMLAFHLGCNPIYLVGFDHDFMDVTKEEYDAMIIAHFYKNPEAQNAKSMSWDEWRVARSRMLHEYEFLRTYAAKWGFTVFDATRGGKLNVFPAIDFEQLFVDGFVPTNSANSTGAALYTPKALAEAAMRLLDDGATIPALKLLDDAIARNINTHDRVAGLQYLRAIGLARLARFEEALLAAREDHACNANNRALSRPLIVQLEKKCGS